jgi:tetratricopeptide (TPR) repeat protein
MQIRSFVLRSFFLAAAVCLTGTASYASGGGSMPSGGGSSSFDMPSQQTPEQIAKSAHNAGVKYIEKADKLEKEAATLDAGKKEKTIKKANSAYESAAKQFERAVKNDPSLYQSWNYLGYSRRHLGDYEASLQAYEQALSINPNYNEAIEYRAEAYLGLNRLDDAKQSYMKLFSNSRELAGQLIASMQRWVESRRTNAAGLDPSQLDAFAKWVEERAQVASQTAAVQFDSSSDARWQTLR